MDGVSIDPKLKVIGITGGSGSGKSIVSHYFKRERVRVIDADEVARYVVRKGTPCLRELTQSFGKEILNKDGTLNRKLLGHMVFSDEGKLALINEITHKYITEEILERINKTEDIDGAVIDAAALLECDLHKYCTAIIAVVAERDLRILRIARRDKISKKDAAERIDAQHPNSYYANAADFVIYNNGNLNELELEAHMVYNIIFGENWGYEKTL